MTDNTEILSNLAKRFEETQTALYSEGNDEGWAEHKELLFQREREQRRAYREALFQHFGTVSALPDNLYDFMQSVHPEHPKISFDLPNTIDQIKRSKLPFMEEGDNTPFKLSSPYLEHRIFEYAKRSEHDWNAQPSMATIDQNEDGFHISFSHLPNSRPGASPTNTIERLATQIHEEMRVQIGFKPVHFYVHVPPEKAGFDKEVFQQVEMKRNKNNEYETPSWGKPWEEIPAGIDQGLDQLVQKPEINRQADYKDEAGAMHDFRHLLIEEYQAG